MCVYCLAKSEEKEKESCLRERVKYFVLEINGNIDNGQSYMSISLHRIILCVVSKNGEYTKLPTIKEILQGTKGGVCCFQHCMIHG